MCRLDWIRLGSNPSLAVPIDHETFRYPTDIASPTAGVRLIDDTCAPITTRKLWSNGNSVKSARLSLARSREITFDRSTTTPARRTGSINERKKKTISRKSDMDAEPRIGDNTGIVATGKFKDLRCLRGGEMY